MNYIVLDLEWNQSPSGKRNSNKHLPFEIIEIGAVKLNNNFKEVDRFSELIKPMVYRNINHVIGHITHITAAKLSNARPFREVMQDFLKFCGDNYVFCTWGNLDLLELQRNMKYFGMKPLSEGPIRFMDLQKMFALQTEGKKHQHTLEYAVDYFGIEKDIPFHRALADAHYTAKIMPKIKRKFRKRVSYDTYQIPKTESQEVRITFDNYYKYISQGFQTKREAMNDAEVSCYNCYLCKRKTVEIVPWFSNNSKHYYSLFRCRRHGFMKGKLRIRKTEEETVFVVKTVKHIGKNEKTDILKKHEKYLQPAIEEEKISVEEEIS